MLPKMLKKSTISAIFITIAMALLCIPSQHAHAQNAMSREHQPAKKTVTEAKLLQQLSFLCDTLC